MSWKPAQETPPDICPLCRKVVYHAERIKGTDGKEWHRACLIKHRQGADRQPGVFESDPIKQGKAVKPGVFNAGLATRSEPYQGPRAFSDADKEPSLSREEARMAEVTSRPAVGQGFSKQGQGGVQEKYVEVSHVEKSEPDICPFCGKTVYFAERQKGKDGREWHRACVIREVQESVNPHSITLFAILSKLRLYREYA